MIVCRHPSTAVDLSSYDSDIPSKVLVERRWLPGGYFSKNQESGF